MKNISPHIHRNVFRRVHRHTTSNKRIYASTLSIIAISSLGMLIIFFSTRGTTPHTSELAFTEHSTLGAATGSVIPASCNSVPPTDHWQGDCAPTINFWIDQGKINPGEAYTIHWRTENAVRCDIYMVYDNGQWMAVNLWQFIPSAYDTVWGDTYSTRTYQINCVGAAGTFSAAQATINVRRWGQSTDYCTGPNDVNGNNWQNWAYQDSDDGERRYENHGTSCVPVVNVRTQ